MRIVFNLRRHEPETNDPKETYNTEFQSEFVPRAGDTILLPDLGKATVERVEIYWDHTYAVVWTRTTAATAEWQRLLQNFPGQIAPKERVEEWNKPGPHL